MNDEQIKRMVALGCTLSIRAVSWGKQYNEISGTLYDAPDWYQAELTLPDSYHCHNSLRFWGDGPMPENALDSLCYVLREIGQRLMGIGSAENNGEA